jgi:hypothetical protein
LKEREFITRQSAKLKLEGIKTFPEDFCNLSNTRILNIPEKNLILGKDFFGSQEITTTSGETVLNVQDQLEAKFIIYSSRKGLTKIRIPRDINAIAESVKKYENYLDELLIRIKNDYEKESRENKNIGIISGEILKKLNLTRL